VLHHNAFSGDGYTGTELANALEMHSYMGYNFALTAVVAKNSTIEGEVDIRATVTQFGVAPFYYDLALSLDCSDLPNQLVLPGVDEIIDKGDSLAFDFRNVPATEECLSHVTFGLVSSMAYPERPIKFAQGSSGSVVLNIPLPGAPVATEIPTAAPSLEPTLAPPRALLGLRLLDTSDPLRDLGYISLSEISVVDLSVTGDFLTIVAESDGTEDKISFNLDNGDHTRTESVSPYCLNGDSGGKVFYPASELLETGLHSLQVTVLDDNGAIIDSATVNFRIQNSVLLPPIASPTQVPTPAQGSSPTSTPLTPPTKAPLADPSASPTAKPTGTPTAIPTSSPTLNPLAPPTPAPLVYPTAAPVPMQTDMPIPLPTTANPLAPPTRAPLVYPTAAPVAVQTDMPIPLPTTLNPLAPPTRAPLVYPTAAPVPMQTDIPIPLPTTVNPLAPPTRAPLVDPTAAPVPMQTDIPIPLPTNAPTPSPQGRDGVITGLRLLDTTNPQRALEYLSLTTTSVIHLAVYGKSLTIVAEADGSEDKVYFNLDNGDHKRTEGVAPYCLNGDKNGNFYPADELEVVGVHSLLVVARDSNGFAIDTVSVDFEIMV